MRARIVNLANSPFDLNSLKGEVRLPALGEVTEDFDTVELEALRGWGVFTVEDAPAPKSKLAHPVKHSKP